MNKNKFIVFPCFIFIIYFSILGMISDDNHYSLEESRKLKTWDELEEKDYSMLPLELEDYVVDQFPKRSNFLKTYSLKDKFLGKYFTRAVYVSRDGWIFAESSKYDMDSISSNLGNLLNKYPNKSFYYAIVPSKNLALKEKYSFTKNTVAIENYEQLLENLSELDQPNFRIIDLIPKSQDKNFLNDETKWYPTDFHWNALGAKSATSEILTRLGDMGHIDTGDYYKNIVLKEFKGKKYKGDLNKRFSSIYEDKAYPIILESQNKNRFKYYIKEKEIPKNQVSRNSIIAKNLDQDELTYSDIYTSNLSYYKVVNEDAINKETLLIIKDSMQNPTTDIFSELFERVKVVDARFPQELRLEELISDCDKIMFFFHQNNDSKETGTYIKSISK